MLSMNLMSKFPVSYEVVTVSRNFLVENLEFKRELNFEPIETLN